MAILLKQKIQRKRRVSSPVDPHGFESIGDILRRMRRDAERQMTDTFDRALSLRLDQLLDQEERAAVSNLRR